MKTCPYCGGLAFGYLHRNQTEVGYKCCECGERFDREPVVMPKGIDFEELILVRQESEWN